MRRAVRMLIVTVVLAGCGGKWSWSDSGTVGARETQAFRMAPPSREHEQRYRLHVKTSGGKVAVHVVAEADEASAVENLRAGKKPGCLTLAQPASNVEEMVFALRQAPPTGNVAIILTNAGEQSVSVTFRAEER